MIARTVAARALLALLIARLPISPLLALLIARLLIGTPLALLIARRPIIPLLALLIARLLVVSLLALLTGATALLVSCLLVGLLISATVVLRQTYARRGQTDGRHGRDQRLANGSSQRFAGKHLGHENPSSEMNDDLLPWVRSLPHSAQV